MDRNDRRHPCHADELIARWHRDAIEIVTNPSSSTESQRALAFRFLLQGRARKRAKQEAIRDAYRNGRV